MMSRVQLVLIGLPIFLFCSDILNLFSHKPTTNHDQRAKQQQPIIPDPEPLPFPTTQKPSFNIGASIGLGSSVNIAFCTSCSYKGNAVTMKNMLEAAYPGLTVVLENYPPTLPKSLLIKVVTVAQVGIIGTVLMGDKILPRLGISTPPPWYHSLRANKFRSLASVWMFGNFAQSYLQSTGAFEVRCNGQLVFSKLKEQRFPGEIELRELVGKAVSVL